MPLPVIGSQTISIGELFELGSFLPAKVQRDYCWTEAQQSALLEDLVASFGEFGFDPDAEEDPPSPMESGGADAEPMLNLADRDPDLETSAPFCYLGGLVLMPGPERFEIYDGLQRLTTLTVIFAVMRDLLGAVREKPIVKMLQNEAGLFRLSLPMKHNSLEMDVLTLGRTAKRYRPLPTITEAGERLRECVTVARAKFHGWPPRRLEAFAVFLMRNVLITVTQIADRRIAGKAFVSINAGGVPLKPEEIVKGQLIDLAAPLPDADEAAGRILFVWRSLQEDLGKAGFDDFLRSVDFIERRAPQSVDYAIQLMEHIRRRYPGQQGYRWATDLLLQYRAAFKWVYEARDEEVAVGVHASLRRLQLLKWDQWRAYAMLIKMKSRPHDLDHRIDVLDRVCFALTLATPDPRRCAEMLGRRLERFAKGGFGKLGGFTFSEIQLSKMERALNGPLPDSGRRGAIMRWVEAAAHGDRVPRYISDSTSSVEHVYPRNPGQNWLTFESDIELGQTVTVREMIGNLCLVPVDELGNASFEEKRKEYQRLRGCRFASEISRSKLWTPDLIRARTKKLAEQTLAFIDIEPVKSPA
ncbi:MAG TPA: DUF262 domain-containing HNH endonuclease family protein [Hyphomonadaceae bacterium]|nr:DUF262 domain-containing HNH endonuclease family protein [Hyphomonadaceae bacterium]